MRPIRSNATAIRDEQYKCCECAELYKIYSTRSLPLNLFSQAVVQTTNSIGESPVNNSADKSCSGADESLIWKSISILKSPARIMGTK